MEWQPIETAPKDGTLIVVRGAGGSTGFAKWGRIADDLPVSAWVDPERLYPIYSEVGFELGDPTHWMPIPEPPLPEPPQP